MRKDEMEQRLVVEYEKIDWSKVPPAPWWKRLAWRIQEAWWSVLDLLRN